MEKLRLLRLNKGLSQQRLADLLDVSQQSVYKYENDISEPDIQTLKRLSGLFHTSIDYIVGNTENPMKNDFMIETALTNEELEYLRMYRNIPDRRRRIVEAILREFDQDNAI